MPENAGNTRMMNKRRAMLYMAIMACLCGATGTAASAQAASGNAQEIIGTYCGTIRMGDPRAPQKRQGPLTIEIKSADSATLHAELVEEYDYSDGDYQAKFEQRIEAQGRAVWNGTQWDLIFDRGTQHITATQTDTRDGTVRVNKQDAGFALACIIDGDTILKHPSLMAATNLTMNAMKNGGQPAAVSYGLKASASPREIKVDGSSTITVDAVLSEYREGDREGRPAKDKKIAFAIDPQKGKLFGSLSAPEAYTDAGGRARVVYTAPAGADLQAAGFFVNTATVTASCDEHGARDIAYISFLRERGKVSVEPGLGGVISSNGIVPPDRRFPALITAFLEDENLQPLAHAEVTFSLEQGAAFGMLRSADGRQGTKLSLKTDGSGIAEAFYIFSADAPPKKAVTESVNISSASMAAPLRARISIGLNIVFDKVESTYEGRGMVSAGEEVPLRVRIKDAWNPDLDLAPIIGYWGTGGKAGDTGLAVRLEVHSISSAPACLLDLYKSRRYPDPGFAENMRVRSFPDKGERNWLWMSQAFLKQYGGYPRVRPGTPGQNYYEARVCLADAGGKPVFVSSHPAAGAFLQIPTDVAADAFSIFFLSNPFGPHTRQARAFRAILDLAGFGAVLSLADAADAINRGQTEDLLVTLFSELKGGAAEKIARGSGISRELAEMYAQLSFVEKITSTAADEMGPLGLSEDALLRKLAGRAAWGAGRLVVLRGAGAQELVAAAASGQDQKPVAAVDGKITQDKKSGIVSLKKGGTSIYIVPSDMQVEPRGAADMRRY